MATTASPRHGDSPYVRAVIETYTSMPGTPERASRQDRRLARGLEDNGVVLDIVLAAIVVGTARRTFRATSSPPLQPVRTLAYFLKLLDEMRADPHDPDYVAYLRAKLMAI